MTQQELAPSSSGLLGGGGMGSGPHEEAALLSMAHRKYVLRAYTPVQALTRPDPA